MLKKEEFLQLRTSYIEIGKLLQKYGYGECGGILQMLMGQVNCIDSDEDDNEKIQYLVDSYKSIFQSYFFTDFVICVEPREVRRQLNEKLDGEVEKVWQILKDYL